MPPRRPKQAWIWFALGLVAVGLVALGWLGAAFMAGRRPLREDSLEPAPDAGAPRDIRLSFTTPYRNTAADVGYVGDMACAECHEQISASYHRHPMGRSMAPVEQAERIERFDETARNPFTAEGLTFQVTLDGSRMIHSESKLRAADGVTIAEARFEVGYVIGSGRQGRSYLTDRDGYLCMSPITWYPQKEIWDLSPGYETNNQHFHRAVPAVCLFCHTNHADLDATTVNRYPPEGFRGEPIGCERCHGPGTLHVARHQRGDVPDGLDDTIVNPADLAPMLRDAVCEQCHLSGVGRVLRRNRRPFDYRPGLPLDMFWAVFAKPSSGQDTKFVGHVEQMHASQCFQQSDGALHCASCHDPHALPDPADKVDYFRQRCLDCHVDRGCRLDEQHRRDASPADDCVACHMTRVTTEVRHTAATDHRITRFASSSRTPTSRPATRDDGVPIVNFYQQLREQRQLPLEGDDDGARDLGIAIMMSRDLAADLVGRSHVQAAFQRLQRACQQDPHDLEARDALGHAAWALGDAAGATEAFQQVLQIAPRREFTLDSLAALAQSRGQHASAIEYWERAIATNPWQMKYYLRSALSLAHLHQWEPCVTMAAKALEIDPANPGARQLLVESYLGLESFDRADRQFELLLELDPARAADRQKWYQTHPLNRRE